MKKQSIMIYQAILLLGATGTGKTPLGQFLEKNGLHGCRCCHFDFGQQLRDAVYAPGTAADISPGEQTFLKRVLEEGLLLENRNFAVARKLLSNFIETRQITAADLVVLNGLPRHRGQAAALSALVEMKQVVYLQADAETVAARIRTNAGGDREGRLDDQVDLVRKKLAIFARRTLPLLGYYRTSGVEITTVNISVKTNCHDIADELEK